MRVNDLARSCECLSTLVIDFKYCLCVCVCILILETERGGGGLFHKCFFLFVCMYVFLCSAHVLYMRVLSCLCTFHLCVHMLLCVVLIFVCVHVGYEI